VEFSGITLSLNTGLILLALVALETVLSADNAVALAALVQPLQDPKQQQKALNWGLAAAFILRIALLFMATWVIRFWQFEFVGAIYLLWLAGKHFWEQFRTAAETTETEQSPETTLSFWRVIPYIAFTDLAFSLDSVTTAVAFSDQLWLVLTGCIIGVVTLRFLAGLFVRWLEEFIYLQDAAYLTVLEVGLRLLCKATQPDLVLPDWLILTTVAVLFAWGFSKRSNAEVQMNSTAVLAEQTTINPFD
jgi:YkoY family integral membrane protein